MTDLTKFKNVSISKQVYLEAGSLQNKLSPMSLSKSQVVSLGVRLLSLLVKHRIRDFYTFDDVYQDIEIIRLAECSNGNASLIAKTYGGQTKVPFQEHNKG